MRERPDFCKRPGLLLLLWVAALYLADTFHPRVETQQLQPESEQTLYLPHVPGGCEGVMHVLGAGKPSAGQL